MGFPAGTPSGQVSIRDTVEHYIGLGWYPIPLNQGTKECRDAKWKEMVYGPEDFNEGDNVGLRLVRSTDEHRKVKLVGVDLDADETVQVAPDLLPATTAAWGRDSKAISQVLYDSQFGKAIVYKDDETGKTLVEIRVDHQSMAPPSVHPCGERLRWLPGGPAEVPKVDSAALMLAVKMVASAALVMRYYPPEGARHDWGVAVCGIFKNLGVPVETTLKIITTAAKHKKDRKVEDRVSEVGSTYRLTDNMPTAGQKRLIEIEGERGKHLATSLRKIWGQASEFVVAKDKVVPNNQDNIIKALEKLQVRLAFDEFARRITVTVAGGRKRQLEDDVLDWVWLTIEKQFNFRPSRDYFDTVIRNEARSNPYHPVQEYLDGLKWDGVPRVDDWMIRLGEAGDSPYTRAVTRLMMVAAVRRIRRPGAKFDELVILESIQGKNKSTALQTLCPNEEWFSNDLPLGCDAKEVIERTSGKWIIEASELLGMRRGSQAETLKSFLSRQVDGPVRMAYGRLSVEAPRQFIIIGTTNAHEYLKDSTGNRRFWPVRVVAFDIGKLEAERDQLWAEASQAEAAGESIRLRQDLYGDAEMQQDRRAETDPWEEAIDHYIRKHPSSKQRVAPETLWKLVGVSMDRRTTNESGRLSSIMQKLGFRRMTVTDDERHVVKGWGRDDPKGVLLKDMGNVKRRDTDD